jgi:muramidase (phage lysozyme)
MIALAGIPANRAAFLDMIAWSEGTSRISDSDNGYNVLVGGTLFEGYADHPRQLVFLPKLGIYSTAAGRYQLLARYFDDYKATLGLSDFLPESQDVIALEQIKECGAAEDMIDMGNLLAAIGLCAHIWASLPGSSYGQLENTFVELANAFKSSGGELA